MDTRHRPCPICRQEATYVWRQRDAAVDVTCPACGAFDFALMLYPVFARAHDGEGRLATRLTELQAAIRARELTVLRSEQQIEAELNDLL